MSTDLGTAVVGFQADTSGFVGGFGIVRTLLGSLPGLALAGTAAIVGLGVASVKMAADFQGGLTSLVTGAGESAKNIEMVGQGILGMSVSTATSTKQLTDGMFMIESAGYRGAEGLAVLKNAAMGAKVGNADLGVVADATTTIMRDYSISAGNSSQAVNALIATVQNGKTHMQDLASSLSQILPTSSAARVGLTDVMGAMATMTGEGVPAAQAATYLRQTIMGLEAPGKAARKAMEDVGLSSSQVAMEMQRSLPGALKMITDAVGKKFPEGSVEYVQAIKNISGGTKTMQGMLDLTGTHMKDFQSNVQNVSAAVKQGGTSILGWSVVQQDFSFQMEQMKAAVNVFMISIGTAFLPVLTKLLGTVTPLIVAFTNWVVQSGILANVSGTLVNALDAVQQATVIISAYVSGIATPVFGALSPIIATNASRFTTLTSTLTSEATPAFHTLATVASGEVNSSLKGLQPVITNLAQGFGVTMVKANDALLASWQKVAAFSQGPLMDALNSSSNWMISTGTPVYTAFSHVVSDVLGGSFRKLSGDVYQAMLAMEKFELSVGQVELQLAKLAIPAALGDIKTAFSALLNVQVGGGGNIGSMIGNMFSGLGTAIHNALGAIGNFLATSPIFQPIRDAWNKFMGDMMPTFKQFGEFWTKEIVPALQTFSTTLGDFLTAAKNNIVLVLGYIPGVVFGYFELVIKYVLGIFQILAPPIIYVATFIINVMRDMALVWGAVWSGMLGLVQHFLDYLNSVTKPGLFGIIREIVDGFASLKDKTGANIQLLINTIESVFNQLPSKMFTWGVNMITGLINGIKNMIGGVGPAIISGFQNIPGFSLLLHDLHLPGFAMGGTTPGGPILVGEHGPEILSPPSGYGVTPLTGGYSGSSGGGDIHNYFIVDGEQLAYKIMTRADQMARAKYGPRGRS